MSPFSDPRSAASLGHQLLERSYEVCQVFCVNDLEFVLGFVVALGFAVVVFGDGSAREGAVSLPSPSDVEGFSPLMTRFSPGPAFVPATEC